MDFGPGLRHHHGGSIFLRQPEIFIGQLVGLFGQAARDNRAHFVELFK